MNNLDPGNTLAYFVKREGFNALRIGNIAEFEVEKGKLASIARVETDS
ncbi:MAG: hypothetical protein QXU73_04860 [Thermoplasmata archaeon]